MYRLTYVSTATPGVSIREVESMAKQASDKNTRAGISGALVFNGRNFVQVLEGEAAPIKSLVEAIEHDKRHFGVRIVEASDDVDACFTSRGMIFVSNAKRPSEWQAVQKLVADVTLNHLPEETRELLMGALALS